MTLPTPHLDKILAAINNPKMTGTAQTNLLEAKNKYDQWIINMNNEEGDKEELVSKLVSLFQDYKFNLDFNIIFSCSNDVLYRQKGQLKLDNSVIEEFLPYLVNKIFPDLEDVVLGPTKCYSSTYFKTTLSTTPTGGGLTIKSKDQDFAIAKKLYIKSSHNSDFSRNSLVETYLGYVTAECKTNLDKTMFQEASATAHDVKSALPGAKYFLLCEWLDMAPASTAATDIDEVLILRKAKRLSANIRSSFSSYAGRQQKSAEYKAFLEDNPFDEHIFLRFVNYVESIIHNSDPTETTALTDGFF